MRYRSLLACLVLLACLAAGSAPASAGSLVCTPTITKLRYQPQITYACTGGSPLTSFAATVVRTPANTPVAVTTGFTDSTATVDLASLASAAHYQIDASFQDSNTDVDEVISTWTTLPPPAHPKISVEYLTAMDPAAVRDMLHRLDAANLVAVPTASHVIDVSQSSPTVAGLEADLNGKQVALVVGGDVSFAQPGWLGRALAWFAGRGHGVVTAGQTHWVETDVWPYNSALGEGTAWDNQWDVYGDDAQITPDRIHGGTLLGTSVQHQFITNGVLKTFQVIGPGSGEVFPHYLIGSQVLATLRKAGSGFFHSWAETLLTIRQVNATRLVDLGYRPWSSAVAGGGFDPSVSPGGMLLARSLEWAANRIPPIDTHFVSKPHNPSAWATFGIGFAAKDADLDHAGALRFRYRMDGGAWHWAPGYATTFIDMAKGRWHTIQAYAVDSGGNRDPHTARYRFFIAASARS